jgi:twitching motility protein PilT
VELLRVTRSIRECIRMPGRLGDIPELMKRGRDLYGMQLFDQHLLELVSKGKISLEVAVYASSNPEELERAMTIE